MSIHQNLRRLRAQSGMTQEQVAEQLGLTRQALSSYESGRTRPDIDMLLRLCQVYHTDLEGLVYGDTERLRWERRVKLLAFSVLGVLLALTAISSALLWSAHTFFPLTDGQIVQAGDAVVEAHFRLADAWEAVDGLILTTALLGFLALLLMARGEKRRAGWKKELLYLAVLAAGVLLLPLPFALTDPAFGPIDYLITPLSVVMRMLLFALLMVFCRPPEEETALAEKPRHSKAKKAKAQPPAKPGLVRLWAPPAAAAVVMMAVCGAASRVIFGFLF